MLKEEARVICLVCAAATFAAGCSKEEAAPAQTKAAPPATTAKAPQATVVFDTKVWSSPNDYKSDMCPLVDQAWFYTKPPRDPALEAADAWCRGARLPARDPKTPKIPVVVQQSQPGAPDRVFYTLIDRRDLEIATNACSGAAAFLPAVIPDAQTATYLSAIAPSACQSISKELARDNPMVVIGATQVIANGLVNDVAQLMQQSPELAGIGKAVEAINNKIADTVRDTVKKPIDWAIGNPKEALSILQPQLAVMPADAAKRVAEASIAFLQAAKVPDEILRDAAKSVGGDAGKILSAAADLVAPVSPAALESAAKQAAEAAKREAENAVDAARRSDLNPGNWRCCKL